MTRTVIKFGNTSSEKLQAMKLQKLFAGLTNGLPKSMLTHDNALKLNNETSFF
jgi:hypothetical protein